jgi:hypothetical protein
LQFNQTHVSYNCCYFKFNRYAKPAFDSEKVYQLIAEIVDKIFLPTVSEEEDSPPTPYVSKVFSEWN